MPVLSQRTLDSLPDTVAGPGYDRSQVTEGIVHFGVGGFHRAHQAMYVDALMNQGEALDFGIVGVGTMPGDTRMRDALNGQDLVHARTESNRRTVEARVIGSIGRYLYAPGRPEPIVAKLADPRRASCR
jgi:mannitol 2-dehydrogenase